MSPEQDMKLKEMLATAHLPLILESPSPLDKDFIKELEERFSALAEKKIEFETRINPKAEGQYLYLSPEKKINLSISRHWVIQFKEKLSELREEELGGIEDVRTNIKRIIEESEPALSVEDIGETGSVLQVGDGIARVSGLGRVGANEIVRFSGGVFGLAFSLEREEVGCILLGPEEAIEEGSPVTRTGRLLQVPVGEAMVGRIVNALGQPIDGKGAITSGVLLPIEKKAPGVVSRQPVKEPLHTGIKSIDALIPIGRGQRELIIGDRKIGKTALAVDTIINQKNSDIICIYAAIGQKASSVGRVVKVLQERGAIDYTILVAAFPNEQTAFRYLVPYAACAIGEYFMEKGQHALVIYDDLSKHAVAYREMSALLKRPIGREAYPGDIFYIHSRLLERAAKLRDDLGGGSLTAIPIVETMGGDVAAYIPTNIISITDGQIYLESDLFNAGFRPAINVGLSVSRVGGAAQIPAMKKIAGPLRINLAQYHEMATFVKFGAELDAATRAQLARGQRGRELLKQPQYQPMPVEEQVVLIYAVVEGYLDDVPVDRISEFETAFLDFLRESRPEILEGIEKEKDLTPEDEDRLKAAISEFKQTFLQSGEAEALSPEESEEEYVAETD
jgi:F-type H+-transporting ATPase subunit alpha